MRIYTKLVIDIETGKLIEEQSYDYQGAIALCFGGSSVPSPPSPSGQESQIMLTEADLLKGQGKLLKDIKPFMLRNLGLEYDKDGKLRRIAKTDQPEDANVAALKQRQKDAMLGIINAPLQASLAKARAGFPVNAGGTIGAQAGNIYGGNAAIVADTSNRATIGSAGQLVNAREGLLSNLQTREQQMLSGAGEGNMKLAGAYNALLGPYQAQRQQAYQRMLQQSGNEAAETAAMYQAGGAILGGIIMAASSKEFKKDIKKVDDKKLLAMVRDSTVKSWKYKGESDDSKGHIGVIAEEAPDMVVTEDGKHLDIVSYMGLLSGAVKALAKKVDKTEGLLRRRT